MKSLQTTALVTATFAFVLAAPVLASASEGDEADDDATRIGLGAKFGVNHVTNEGGSLFLRQPAERRPATNFTVPIKLGEDFRIEPHVGFRLHDSTSEDAYLTDTGEETRTWEREMWMVDVGAALHHRWASFEHAYGYAGLKGGISYKEDKSTQGRMDEQELEDVPAWTSRTLYAGPVLGAEYQPHEVIGLGAELSLGASYQSSERTSQGALGEEGEAQELKHTFSGLNLYTQANIVARVYLW